MNRFKIRASQCGKIMGQRGLGKTGETYVKEWLMSQIYNREKEIKSKYLDKGNLMENDAIKYLQDNSDYFLLEKNEIPKQGRYMQGTCDIIQDDHIIDIKCSWDWTTFPYLEKDIPNMDYYWQGQCYMELYKKEKYKLAYILMPTPDELIFSEKPDYYDDLTPEKRIKIFEFERKQSDIDLIIERVKECRKIIESYAI